MTENEAIEELKYDCNEIGKAIPCDTSWGESFENAYAMAINALEEVQQYRTIGTPEECREAVEKQTDEKPTAVLGTFGGTEYECKNCGSDVCYGDEYCRWCGQKLDWSDEDEKI